ncbi:hypothetical protein ACM66B_004628 [Microbotryomycetes sp. NB124-2]
MTSGAATWTWSPQYQLYWSPELRKWAKANGDGTFEYEDAVTSSSSAAADNPASSRRVTSYADIDEGQAPLPDYREKQEWPSSSAGDDDAGLRMAKFRNVPHLRFVLASPPTAGVLASQTQRIAMFDPERPVVIGRDKTFEPRLRLKDLAVSKSHATVFWDEQEMHWAIVDSGSTHGTWIRRAEARSEDKFRLSEPKVASSTPHKLEHGDQLSIGSTRFRVHVHASFACSDCSLAQDSSNLIPFVSLNDPRPSDSALTGDRFESKTKEDKEQDRRSRMQSLKQQYLATPTSHTPIKFKDRAKERRSRDGATASITVSRNATPDMAARPAATVTVSQQPTVNPFAADSKGARLLSKLGGAESSSSGGGESQLQTDSRGLGKLVEARTVGSGLRGVESRPGLGSKPLVDAISADASSGASQARRPWLEHVREANRKRFQSLQ